MNAKPAIRSKTFWTGLAAVATGIGLIVAGDVGAGVQTIIAGLTAIFLRDAISTSLR